MNCPGWSPYDPNAKTGSVGSTSWSSSEHAVVVRVGDPDHESARVGRVRADGDAGGFAELPLGGADDAEHLAGAGVEALDACGLVADEEVGDAVDERAVEAPGVAVLPGPGPDLAEAGLDGDGAELVGGGAAAPGQRERHARAEQRRDDPRASPPAQQPP